MSDITYSDDSTFVKGFTPSEETIQAQMGTEILQRQIRDAKDAKTRQRQVDAAQRSPEEMEDMEEIVERTVNQEEEIIFASSTPRVMTEIDLARNKRNNNPDNKEEGIDPTGKLGNSP